MKIPHSTLVTAVLSVLLTLSASFAQAGTCYIDYDNTKQTIRGFGAALLSWQGTIPDSYIDKGFGAGGGSVGLTIGRVRVSPSNSNSTDIGYGARAKTNGAILMATPWSPPAILKSNNNTIGGSLNTADYAAYANHLVDAVNEFKDNGASVYAVSVQNEPDIEVSYESCDWTADQLRDFVRDEMGAFYTTKVIASESFNFKQSYTDPILNNTTAANNIDIVGGHIYGGGLASYNAASNAGKEIWMTEHLDNDFDTSAVIDTAKDIHDFMNVMQGNAFIYWYLKRDYSVISEAGNRTKRGCVFAQWARVVRPGWVRVSATDNPSSNVYVTAYKSGGTIAIVAVNTGPSGLAQDFSLSGEGASTLNRWRTSDSQDLETISSINSSSGEFWSWLPGNSVTTFYE